MNRLYPPTGHTMTRRATNARAIMIAEPTMPARVVISRGSGQRTTEGGACPELVAADESDSAGEREQEREGERPPDVDAVVRKVAVRKHRGWPCNEHDAVGEREDNNRLERVETSAGGRG